MEWKVIIGLFAKPVGAALNNAVTMGSAAVTAWAISKGADAGIVTPIIGAVAAGLSFTVSALAATQGVQIPIINKAINGVRVVDSEAADRANLPAANGPK